MGPIVKYCRQERGEDKAGAWLSTTEELKNFYYTATYIYKNQWENAFPWSPDSQIDLDPQSKNPR